MSHREGHIENIREKRKREKREREREREGRRVPAKIGMSLVKWLRAAEIYRCTHMIIRILSQWTAESNANGSGGDRETGRETGRETDRHEDSQMARHFPIPFEIDLYILSCGYGVYGWMYPHQKVRGWGLITKSWSTRGTGITSRSCLQHPFLLFTCYFSISFDRFRSSFQLAIGGYW